MIAFISIEVEPLLIEFGKSGVDISCVVNDTNLIGITNILLKRSESYVVSVTEFKIAWQDKALENKTGVTVNASINIILTSYLRLEISRTAVRFPEDMGSYQCILIAVTASGELKQYQSQSIVLNITGNQTKTIPWIMLLSPFFNCNFNNVTLYYLIYLMNCKARLKFY